jgi:hypothetical protein
MKVLRPNYQDMLNYSVFALILMSYTGKNNSRSAANTADFYIKVTK